MTTSDVAKPDSIPAPAGAESDATFLSHQKARLATNTLPSRKDAERLIAIGCEVERLRVVVSFKERADRLARRASTAPSEKDVERVEQAIRENIRPDRDIKDAARAALAAAPHCDYRAGLLRAAEIAEWAHMVLPDGGCPTDEEKAVADEAAKRIRAEADAQPVPEDGWRKFDDAVRVAEDALVDMTGHRFSTDRSRKLVCDIGEALGVLLPPAPSVPR